MLWRNLSGRTLREDEQILTLPEAVQVQMESTVREEEQEMPPTIRQDAQIH